MRMKFVKMRNLLLFGVESDNAKLSVVVYWVDPSLIYSLPHHRA